MPVYEYRCKNCGRTHEIEHGFQDPRPTECPACGGTLVRIFHPVGVVFKGSGFHKTDYAKSGVRKEPSSTGSDSAKGDGKPSGDQPASTAKEASGSKEASTGSASSTSKTDPKKKS